MKNKDNVLKMTLSILMIVFGVLLLLDQLDVKFIDDFFMPWYTILVLFIAAALLSFAIVKKAPIIYVLSMFFAGLYLVISISGKLPDLAVCKIIMIIPLFIGLGFVIADKVCKWSPKAMRFGLVTTVASAIILVSTILDVWRYVIPVVIVLIGFAYLLFSIFAVKQETKTKKKNYYVTYEPKDAEANIDENSESFEDSNSEE